MFNARSQMFRSEEGVQLLSWRDVGASSFSPGNPVQTAPLLSWLTRSVPVCGEIQAGWLPVWLPACFPPAVIPGRGEARLPSLTWDACARNGVSGLKTTAGQKPQIRHMFLAPAQLLTHVRSRCSPSFSVGPDDGVAVLLLSC